jgi:Bacterial capsule synthesis protein PGA_cap
MTPQSVRADGRVVLAAVGDVFLDRPDPQHAFSLSLPVLAAADIRFANNEGVYSTCQERAPNARGPVVGDPATAAAGLAPARFDVMSVANNHILDGGHRGLRDTLSALRDLGVEPVGAGEDLAAATAPVVLDRAGLRVAVLGYSSVFPAGYEARAAVPGLAPLRAYTFYVPYEQNEWNPGLLPNVITALDDDDADRVTADIEASREQADLVVVSVHWGDYSRPYVLTDHERQAARLFLEAGADAVLGHHHHLLRAVELHEGKPIFYGLSHFAFDQPRVAEQLAAEGITAEDIQSGPYRRRFGEFGIYPRPDYPLLPFHPDARMTVVAVLELTAEGAVRTGVVPCHILPDGRPEPLAPGDQRHAAVLDYLDRCCTSEGIQTRIDSQDTSWRLGGYPVVTLR